MGTGIERNEETGSIMMTGNGIQIFAILQARHALEFEIKTGMKMSRGSVLAMVNRRFGTSFRKKQEAVDYLLGVEAEIKAAAKEERARREAAIASGEFGPTVEEDLVGEAIAKQ